MEYGVDATHIDPEKLRWCTHVVWNFPFTGVEEDSDSNTALLVAFFNGLTAAILNWKVAPMLANLSAPNVHIRLQVRGVFGLESY